MQKRDDLGHKRLTRTVAVNGIQERAWVIACIQNTQDLHGQLQALKGMSHAHGTVFSVAAERQRDVARPEQRTTAIPPSCSLSPPTNNVP
eukprot:152699-Chlamydomonas_euryale.AAC.3